MIGSTIFLHFVFFFKGISFQFYFKTKDQILIDLVSEFYLVQLRKLYKVAIYLRKPNNSHYTLIKLSTLRYSHFDVLVILFYYIQLSLV